MDDPLYWILDLQKIPYPVHDMKKFSEFMSGTDSEGELNKRVKLDLVIGKKRGRKLRVSTVFLGTPHGEIQSDRIGYDKDPILFETMVFNEKSFTSMECERYTTWDAALTGHNKWVKEATKMAEKDLKIPRTDFDVNYKKRRPHRNCSHNLCTCNKSKKEHFNNALGHNFKAGSSKNVVEQTPTTKEMENESSKP